MNTEKKEAVFPVVIGVCVGNKDTEKDVLSAPAYPHGVLCFR